MTTLFGNNQFQKLSFSGGTANGRRIKVAALADPGTLIHTGPSDPTMSDEIWLDAYNSSTAPVALTIEWGAGTSPDDMITVTIPNGQSLTQVIAGNVLLGNATQLTVKAFAALANVITIGGFVNRMQ